jgi:hypothetical protein
MFPHVSGHPLCLIAALVARHLILGQQAGQQTGPGVLEGPERSLTLCLNRSDRSIGALIEAISLSGSWPSLLCQERPTAWRRRPSQGDGGLDVAEPNSRGYHVYQIKGFTESILLGEAQA